MIDFATLVMKADSRGLVDGKTALKDLGDQAGRTEKRVNESTGRMSNSFRTLAARAGALAAVLAPTALFAGAVSEGKKFETLSLKTQQIIQATGGVAGKTADELREQARQLALNTLESTEGIMQAQQTLLTFRNVQGDVFDRAIESATDMAAVLGGNVNTQVLQLAKALENPIQGLSALSRSGTVFTQQQKDMVKAMVEAGRTADAQNFILRELEAQYGGAARAAAMGLAGAQDTLGQRMQELFLQINESLGITDRLTVLYFGMADAVLYVTQKIEDLTEFLRDNAERVQSYAIAAALGFTAYMTPAIIAGTVALGRFAAALLLTRGALIRSGIGILIVALGEAIYFIDQAVEKIGGWRVALGVLGEMAKEVFGRIGSAGNAALYGILSLWQNLKFTTFDVLQSMIDGVINTGNNIINTFEGSILAVQAIWNALPDVMRRVGALAINALIDAMQSGLSGLTEALNAVLTLGGRRPDWAIPPPDLSEWKAVPGEAASIGDVAGEAFNKAFEENTIAPSSRIFAQLAADAASLQALYASMSSSFLDDVTKDFPSIEELKSRFMEAAEAAGATDEELRKVAESLEEINAEVDRLAGTGGGGGGGDNEGLPSVLNDLVPGIQKLAGEAGRMQQAFGNAFADVVLGAQSARDAISGLLDMAARAFLNAAFQNLFAGVFGFQNGGVFSNGGVVAFADGGVVNQPTLFPMTGGRTGLMGEAGPEAVMPLKRGPNGKLGVAANGQQTIRLVVEAEEGELFVPRVRQISGQTAVQVSRNTARAQQRAFPATLDEYDRRGTT